MQVWFPCFQELVSHCSFLYRAAVSAGDICRKHTTTGFLNSSIFVKMCSFSFLRVAVSVRRFAWLNLGGRPHFARRLNHKHIDGRTNGTRRTMQPKQERCQKITTWQGLTAQQVNAGSSRNNRADLRDRMQNRTMNLPDSLRLLLHSYVLLGGAVEIGMLFHGQ